jgi:hypothetical protein
VGNAKSPQRNLEQTGDIVMTIATPPQALTVVDNRQTEIENYLDVRQKATSALSDINDKIAKVLPDLAEQVVAQSSGKPKLDIDTVLSQYKAAKAKHDLLQEEKGAINAVREAVNTHLNELKLSSPIDFVHVIDRQIAVWQQLASKTEEEAHRAKHAIEELSEERNDIVGKYPDAAKSAATVSTAAPTAAPMSSASTAARETATPSSPAPPSSSGEAATAPSPVRRRKRAR